MAHNENTRVKIPALVHLTRLGYHYFSLKDPQFEVDSDTNIIKNVFRKQFLKLNKIDEDSKEDLRSFENEYQNVLIELGQDDLGEGFYNRLTGAGNSSYKIIDRDNFSNNTFHVATELPCKNGEDEFRPDITVFVNGLPLSFIEVKKPNNPEGIKAERDRMNRRFKNEKFRKFINITQLLVFSNNMEYDNTGQDQLQGAFYATTTKGNSVRFNNFREELSSEFVDHIKPIDGKIEDYILEDTNNIVIKHSPEFLTNKDENSPTNRILSSLFSKERLAMILRYGIAYVHEEKKDGGVDIQKHIMRYPQFFASKAIVRRLEEGTRKGIIWHTQGSGKTALAYFNVRYLTDYFRKKGVVPKFYFIVDRIDLLIQTKKEFEIRGLKVHVINSREGLVKDFKSNTTNEGITVINIQKFSEDTKILNDSGYDINVQRVFFIDEAHRSYDPKGSFLANLYNSDKSAIKVALTGTPLIIYGERVKGEVEELDLFGKKDSKTTREIFGNYIHKYYYNSSIKDGYTLRLIREEISTSYKKKLGEVYRELESMVKGGDINKKMLYAHKRFVDPMLEYILNDFRDSRIRFGDESIGAMVVCDSSDQARMLQEIFLETQDQHGLQSALILHDEGDKDQRKEWVENFKSGKIDILFVFNMLLTGFDAPRLKKLYLGRRIKAHNLLQTLTRVNRPYKDFRIGYVVDFADISKEFDLTNKAYFEELNREYDTGSTGENGEDVFGELFMSAEEIQGSLERIKTTLLDYSIGNKELFSQEVSAITNREQILHLRNTLEEARELYNIARLVGHMEVLEQINIKEVSQLITEVTNRLKLLSLQESIGDTTSKQLLNEAIEQVIFQFTKTGEKELELLANDLQETVRKARVGLEGNRNKADPEWISLYEAFKQLLEKHKIHEGTPDLETMKYQSREYQELVKRINELNQKNTVLENRFDGDRKFARMFKRMEPSGQPSKNSLLFDLMKGAKKKIDEVVYKNKNVLSNTPIFRQMLGPILNNLMTDFHAEVEYDVLSSFRDLAIEEYTEEYKQS